AVRVVCLDLLTPVDLMPGDVGGGSLAAVDDCRTLRRTPHPSSPVGAEGGGDQFYQAVECLGVVDRQLFDCFEVEEEVASCRITRDPQHAHAVEHVARADD